jgi:putative hydrolase of the HAD superfamily
VKDILSMQNKKYLIWDFDGTLAYRTGAWSGALTALARRRQEYGSFTPDVVRPFLSSGFPWHAPENLHPGLSADEWWEELFPVFFRTYRGAGVDSKIAAQMAHEVRAEYLDLSSWQRFDDTLPALKSLSDLGWTHVLLTNHVPELPVLLNYLDLTSPFAGCFNSAGTGVEKPNQKAFRAVIDWLGVYEKAWVIGDSYNADFLGATEAGLPAVLVRTPHSTASPCAKTLLELASIINS